MAVVINRRAKKSIRNLYWASTRKSIQRRRETKSLVDAMVKLMNTTPLVVSKENRGVLKLWRNKGYTIYETTHCFVRYSNGIDCKPMKSRKSMKRKWYFACVMDMTNNVVYIVNSVFSRYVDRLDNDTPTALKFMGVMKGIETKRKREEAEKRQLKIQFPEHKQLNINKLTEVDLHRIVRESVNKVLRGLI